MMSTPYFSDVRESDGRYYRDYVARTHWLKLRSFSRALEASGQALDHLDGSSESLVPLWQWVLAGLSVDFSFLEESGPSSAWQGLGVEWDLPMARRTLVNEWLGHYIFEQFRSIDASTEWVFKSKRGRGPQEIAVHQTVIQFRGREVEIQNAFLGMFSMAERGDPQWSKSDSLYNWATVWKFGGATPVSTSPTFMTRALEVSGTDMPPRLLRLETAPDQDDGVALGGIYYIARLAGGEVDLMMASPLSAREVAEVLGRNSYVSAVDERLPLSPEDVDEGGQAVGPDRSVIIDPMSLDGKLQALEVRVFVSDLEEHSVAVARLQALAGPLQATVIAKDLMD